MLGSQLGRKRGDEFCSHCRGEVREVRLRPQVKTRSTGLSCLHLLCCCCCFPVTKLCPALCDPMDCSMPGVPVPHHLLSLPKFMSIESVNPSNHFILCCSLLLLPSVFSSIRVFSMSQFFASGGQSTGASASTAVLPMNIQG